MARVIKTAAARKDELVDCAQKLFLAKGYEATTIADILAAAKLSKGAFYHHFTSKEDLLDAFTARVTRTMIAAARDVLEDETLDALTRLNRFMARGGEWKREAAPMLSAVYASVFKPENAVLYQRMVRSGIAAVMPVLTRIVEQGVREGTFDVPDSAIVAEILLHLSNARQAVMADAMQATVQGDVDHAVAVLEGRLAVEQKIIDRILGVPEGSVRLFEPGYLRTVLTLMSQSNRGNAAKSAA